MTIERLYHVSDQSDIDLFIPRPAPARSSQNGAMVWAIGARLLHNYLLPRNCPRVTFYANEQTTPADRERFMGLATTSHVVAVEHRWARQIYESTLYLYELTNQAFTQIDQTAAYYIARKPIKPVSVTVLDDLPAALATRDVELRFVPTLWPLQDAVVNSTIAFSCIRMSQASPRPDYQQQAHQQ